MFYKNTQCMVLNVKTLCRDESNMVDNDIANKRQSQSIVIHMVCRWRSKANDSRATQQCNTVLYYYAVYWLPPSSSAFLLARKCNLLPGVMLLTGVMLYA